MPYWPSLVVELLQEFEGLLVGDHALVGALHLVHVDDVDVGPGALLEAGWQCHLVEEVSVRGDVPEFLLGTGSHEGGYQPHVLLSTFCAHYLLIIILILSNI